jgi:endonuclease/exonuclease/phosphatase family metal-dependent hydrolase
MDGRLDLARIVAEARRFADFVVLCLQEVADGFADLEQHWREPVRATRRVASVRRSELTLRANAAESDVLRGAVRNRCRLLPL